MLISVEKLTAVDRHLFYNSQISDALKGADVGGQAVKVTSMKRFNQILK